MPFSLHAHSADRLERLRAALAGRRALPYCDALAATCFDFGLFLAKTEMELPEWLGTAPRWARAAVAIGRSAALRVIDKDRLLAPATAAKARAVGEPA